ncbi:putative nucleoplasmin-like protein (NLP) [Leptomonas pyrrhocoris]|uniref:Putative nucleoplasmin-like protein (NLP) n=1 Tax=Leptomonas pyrrhocoris TaxID=157538 RepID=A0A0M9G109_LEPPY|nr:putative nucleoplasmin-like protein (NLP) [Leptomonas pyrrhocoris]XP_015658429.1 putative nucleoplasmin-like protein (NLP) [Leptomonas pyrrhocoris]KPA79989.1 putative nucleoplasmin-like protein (NLP) [Leptomonas pyrrhocoris]KPA79990.1 putative nucleoplasmin-like protein (NLP) [Leptomonas pyrrhocoris]|eukprot:XP_015658428.1 putative nucleoplasmin-like protein (NLP) [Leptomonas pyrrhocoris]
MITARSPFQIYKAGSANGSVSSFNSLPNEDVLPYKIASAEETLVASLAIVETDAAQKEKYAVSTLHAASSYVSHLVSYVPLFSRSQTAKKIDIHYDAIVRTVMLFGTDAALFHSVKSMVLTNAPANQVSLKELSDLEGAFTAMEKEYRQRAKDAGARVDMLRKVAPEPAAVVSSSTPVTTQSSPASSPTTAVANAGEEVRSEAVPLPPSKVNGNSPGRRRPRSQPDEPSAQREVDGVDDVEAKMPKTETTADAADAAAAPETATATVPPATAFRSSAKPRKAKASGGGLVWGRLRGLTSNEKKAVGVLQAIIQILAHVYATRFNDLVPLFDLLEEKVKAVQAIIDAERAQYKVREEKKPPEPFHEVDLAALRTALETSSHIFRTDEECRYELDEDLLHPIAHECLTVINQIEGYDTAPFTAPTPEELEKKQQMRDAARAKREEVKRRIIEKAEAKAELERKKEDEKQFMRRRLGDTADDEEDLEEDTALASPSALGYVAYAQELPLGSSALYEKALYVWSMLVSLPRPLNLSQMYFATFLKGILCEEQDSNGLMEEITKCLLDVSMEVVRVSSPSLPRITTRGKNWFDALVEFVGVASGNKKKRQQQRRREPSTDEEEEGEDEEEDDDDVSSDDDEERAESSSDTTSGGSSSSTQEEEQAAENVAENEASKPTMQTTTGDEMHEKSATTATAVPEVEGESANKPEEAAAEEETDTDLFTLELKATMENITQLRSLATWGNVDIVDRLNLLQFCVQEALGSEDVRIAADRLQKENEDEVANTDKRLKEIRDDAEKELKALLRTLPSVTATVAGAKRKSKKSVAAEPKKNGRKTSALSERKGQNDDVTADERGDAAADEAEAVAEDDVDTSKNPQEEAEKNYEAEREKILKAVDRKRAEVYAHLFSKADGKDEGAIVQPLGMDRYHRLYWRFPMERVVYVQTVPTLTAVNFPLLPEPEELRRSHAMRRAVLLDDEDVELPTRSKGVTTPKPPTMAADESGKASEQEERAATQTEWGVIPFEYLSAFVQTLDRRGIREAPLRRALEALAPYLEGLEEVKEGRVTRSRASMFGYVNRLKVDFSY